MITNELNSLPMEKLSDVSIKIPMQYCSLAATSTSFSAISESEDSEDFYSEIGECF